MFSIDIVLWVHLILNITGPVDFWAEPKNGECESPKAQVSNRVVVNVTISNANFCSAPDDSGKWGGRRRVRVWRFCGFRRSKRKQDFYFFQPLIKLSVEISNFDFDFVVLIASGVRSGIREMDPMMQSDEKKKQISDRLIDQVIVYRS